MLAETSMRLFISPLWLSKLMIPRLQQITYKAIGSKNISATHFVFSPFIW